MPIALWIGPARVRCGLWPLVWLAVPSKWCKLPQRTCPPTCICVDVYVCKVLNRKLAWSAYCLSMLLGLVFYVCLYSCMYACVYKRAHANTHVTKPNEPHIHAYTHKNIIQWTLNATQATIIFDHHSPTNPFGMFPFFWTDQPLWFRSLWYYYASITPPIRLHDRCWYFDQQGTIFLNVVFPPCG